jgi:hypothetical protein
MLKPSRERIEHLAEQIISAMEKDGNVLLLKDREAIRQSVVHALLDELRQTEERVTNVLRRLTGMADIPAEGTAAWEERFRLLLEEEFEKPSFD